MRRGAQLAGPGVRRGVQCGGARRRRKSRYSAAIKARAALGSDALKASVPRTFATRPFGATYVVIPLVTTVVGLTKRPDQTVVALQSVVQFLDVWNTTRGPRTRPARS